MGFNMHHAVILLATIWLIQFSQAYIHPTLELKGDRRDQFFIENFGFTNGGNMTMVVKDWKLSEGASPEDIYFLIRITTIDSTEFLQQDVDFNCPYGANPRVGEGIFISPDWKEHPVYQRTIGESEDLTEGLYNLYFVNCKHKSVSVSFKLHLEMYNYDLNGEKDYLPIGLSPIPTIYIMFSIVYAIMFVVWIFGYMRGQGNILNKVHYLMSLLVVLKFFSLFFYAIEQHYVKKNGVANGWAIAYYIFAVLKTGFFFVIVTLIGTGWSFFKPFLSDKDKKIIMVVIPLQILDNVAMVIIGSSAPGSLGWFTWKDIFRLVDIICCGAVLIPIIWSIKHLREASQSDGKAARNLQKLRLFRQFYLIVVSYIYFTRIIIYLLDATLQYYLIWLGDVFTELATLCFFVVVGYKFRPVHGNPYFNLEEEDAARLEEMHTAEED